MTVRGLLTKEIDPLDFVLAMELGMSLREVESMSNVEIERWRGFLQARAHQQALEEKKARVRRGR